MRTLRRIALFIAVAFCTTLSFGQAHYDEELAQHSGSLRALLVQTERLKPQDVAGRIAIQSELFELAKKLHRLEEEALSANLELQRRGSGPDRKLLLAAATAKSLDLAQALAGFYLDTQDKSLWSAALQAAQSARNLLAQK